MSKLSAEDIDDLLYLTRVHETAELQQTISDLAQKNNCTPDQIVLAGVDPETQNTLLHYASANGFLDLVKSFVEVLGTPVANGTTSSPSQDAKVSFVNKPNREGNTALHWASYNGNLEIVKCLIESGADMWIKNSAGQLAMFEAERADKSEVVQYLLEVGGRRVEQGGVEAQPTMDDIADIGEGEAEAGASVTAGVPNGEPTQPS